MPHASFTQRKDQPGKTESRFRLHRHTLKPGKKNSGSCSNGRERSTGAWEVVGVALFASVLLVALRSHSSPQATWESSTVAFRQGTPTCLNECVSPPFEDSFLQDDVQWETEGSDVGRVILIKTGVWQVVSVQTNDLWWS